MDEINAKKSIVLILLFLPSLLTMHSALEMQIRSVSILKVIVSES